MCGLTGFIASQAHAVGNEATSELNLMLSKIAHRGPNDSGVWIDDNLRVALGHRRLSIVDLSASGHQPMISGSGRFVIAFNGEIYNHLKLRQELDEFGYRSPTSIGTQRKIWNGHSDTETLLVAFETWGIEETLKKTVGMFAISLWDREKEVLTLARDRIGEKPLYYGYQNNIFLFGSELKALKANPNFLSEIDRDVLCLYLRHCYIPAPFSIYKGIRKLLPGTYVQVPLYGEPESQPLSPQPYWSLANAVNDGNNNQFKGSDSQAIQALDRQLKQSIGLQMMADVPHGAFLSGGIDSSTVVSLMQAQSSIPVKTFSIGFSESGYNEALYAKAIAEHLGTDHSEIYVSHADAMAVIPLLSKIYDEPFSDSSQIPTFLVSKMAKEHVTVSLSGDAGDELFCGYNRYAIANNWKKIENVPLVIQRIMSQGISSISPKTWDTVFQHIGNFRKMPENMGDKLNKLAKVLSSDSIQDAYYRLVSEVDQPEQIVIGATEPPNYLIKSLMNEIFKDATQLMMFMDTMTYLPDDILVKVDRASMANSLETRVPFLDHRVVEFAWRLPMNMKMREGETKWILRQVLYQYVPKELIERPKSGFSIPLGEWLRGPLKDWAETLLHESRLMQEGYFNVRYVRNLWQSHLTGKRNHQTLLWSILMFQSWLAENN